MPTAGCDWLPSARIPPCPRRREPLHSAFGDLLSDNGRMSLRPLVGVFAFVLVTCAACGAPTQAVTPRQGARSLLGASSFAVQEVDHSTDPRPSGQFVSTFIGERTPVATEAHVVETGANPVSYTLYATTHTYCHVGTDLSGGGFCDPGDGNDDFITFVSRPIVRSIADGQSHVRSSGASFTFSGASTSQSANPPTTVKWQGTGQVQGNYLAHLHYRVSDSRGGVQMVTVTYTEVGSAAAIQPPANLPS